MYKEWFTKVVYLILSKLKPKEYAIFLQSPIRLQDNKRTIGWVDKSFLCSNAALQCNGTIKIMWHKIIMRTTDMNCLSLGRPFYSHLICYGNINANYHSGGFATPDIIHRGEMLWPKGIGLDCCIMGLAFLKEIAGLLLSIYHFICVCYS